MKNLIVLAMSTLPKNITDKSTAICRENNFEIEYTSQLVPIPAMMLHQYPDDDLDIIILATDKTTEINKAASCSAVQFFQDELKKKYLAQEDRITFYVVDKLDLMNPIAKIDEVLALLRELSSEKNYSQIWLDTHGGLRNVMQVFSALLSLARVYGIKIDMIYDCEYDGNQSIIREQSESFGIFDYFSSMDDFVKYGDAETLGDYYKDDQREEIKKAIAAMKLISSGTEECDPGKYTHGLTQLRNALGDAEKADTKFKIFGEYIRSDYGDLLISNDPDPLLIVQRSLDKHLYQQALTFMESLMGEKFVKSGVLSFDQNGNNATQARKHDKLEREDIVKYMFDALINTQIFLFPKSHKTPGLPKEEQQNKDTKEAIDEFVRLKGSFDQFIETGSFALVNSTLQYNNMKSFTLSEKKKPGDPASYPYYCDVKVTGDKKKALAYLLLMHKALKSCRNFFNHANENRPDMENIKIVLGMYCKLADVLLS